MEKPTDCPVSTDSKYDYDITERVVRQLQESHLHLFHVGLMSSLPDALKTGDPEYDENAGIIVSLSMITDGERGFLILVPEDPDWDAVAEMTELVSKIVPKSRPGETFVVRTACIYGSGEGVRKRTLRLVDPARVRAEVQRAYAEVFADRGRIDHAAFLAAFEPFGQPRDERTLRRELH